MAAIRRNILANPTDRNRFIDGVLALKAESAGFTTTELGIGPGPRASSRPLSTWDLFVIWHVWAMGELSSDGRRNAAHMGPVFLPWHRWYLVLLEFHLQRVLGLGRDDFGLPYWDWAVDGGDLPPDEQAATAPIWEVVGGNGSVATGEVTTGPFTGSTFVINIEQGPGGALRATNRPLRRNFAGFLPNLPTSADVDLALGADTDLVYDRSDWDSGADSFRNRLEGWAPPEAAPAMHNRVHVWVGGDMGPGSSPNDPVFFLNHCNVDRLWDRWQRANPARGYQPEGVSPAGDALFRHRSGDPLYSLLTRAQPSIASMLDVSRFYSYE